MLIEVIFYDRIGNYVPGQVAEIEDGVFLRALIKGGKVDVLNPPDWEPETPYGEKVSTLVEILTEESNKNFSKLAKESSENFSQLKSDSNGKHSK